MYLMGEVTELDEEPSYLITNCYKITGETFEKYPLYSDQSCADVQSPSNPDKVGHRTRDQCQDCPTHPCNARAWRS